MTISVTLLSAPRTILLKIGERPFGGDRPVIGRLLAWRYADYFIDGWELKYDEEPIERHCVEDGTLFF